MHSRDMEYIVGLLKNGKDAEAILSVRRKLNMAFLARTTDLSGKLPVLAFGSTFKKNGDGIQCAAALGKADVPENVPLARAVQLRRLNQRNRDAAHGLCEQKHRKRCERAGQDDRPPRVE